MQPSEGRAVSFAIDLPTNFVLGIEEIWPDGDAPENPTAADVVEQMKNSSGSVSRVITEWALEPECIEVFGNHDASKAVLER